MALLVREREARGQRGGEVSGARSGEHQYDAVAGFGEGTRSIVEIVMPEHPAGNFKRMSLLYVLCS